MLKHIITTRCSRKCEYCISKNITPMSYVVDGPFIKKLEKLYTSMSKKHSQIMITGGEPVECEYFTMYFTLALQYFDEVHLTTHRHECLRWDEMDKFKSITYSLHGREPHHVRVETLVYASILPDEYYMELPRRLHKLGYMGLTINEEQRNGGDFNAEVMPKIAGFSIKINKKGHCLNETIILPDLSIITDFTPYL